MKELLKMIQRDFDLTKCDTTFMEVSAEIEYIKDVYVDEYKDLFTCLIFLN